MHEQPFDLCKLAEAAGANYVARWTSYHVKELTEAIHAGLEVPGLSFIEVMTQCPTSFGSKNKMRLATQMIDMFRENAVLKVKADRDTAAGKPLEPGKFIVGEFVRRHNPPLGVEESK
jgi:2-oxoglutarate ferredoxin oxidoreductase subunit beta